MIQNYIQYPPLEKSDPLHDRINNIQGSIYTYGVLSLVELLLGMVLYAYFFTVPLVFRFLLIIGSIGLVLWAFIDSMFSGGVAVTHALWLIVEIIIIYAALIISTLNRR